MSQQPQAASSDTRKNIVIGSIAAVCLVGGAAAYYLQTRPVKNTSPAANATEQRAEAIQKAMASEPSKPTDKAPAELEDRAPRGKSLRPKAGG